MATNLHAVPKQPLCKRPCERERTDWLVPGQPLVPSPGVRHASRMLRHALGVGRKPTPQITRAEVGLSLAALAALVAFAWWSSWQ